jgi:hypothetical protein
VSDDADTILRHQATLADSRANFDRWWQEIAYRVMPSEATFTTIDTEGTRRTERLFDSTAASANERFAAVMEDLLTPRTQRWHGLQPEVMLGAHDQDLAERQNVREYLEAVNNTLFSMRYRPRANFPSQKHLGYLAIGAFGNSTLFIDEELGQGPRYSTCTGAKATGPRINTA